MRLFCGSLISGMVFATAAAAAAVAATNSPTWMFNGLFNPPLSSSYSNRGHYIGNNEQAPRNEITGEALTVALDVVQIWAVFISLGFTLIIFFFLVFCVCASKDESYDDYECSQGISAVKYCQDGGENGLSVIPRYEGSGATESMRATDEASEHSSRNTMKRELPAIPTAREKQGKLSRPNSQLSPDYYASPNGSQGSSGAKLVGGVQVLPTGVVAPVGRAALVKETVSSPEGEKPKKEVCKTIEEPLGLARPLKTQSTEHPYAKVGAKGTDVKIEKVQDSRKSQTEAKLQSSTVSPEPPKEDKKALLKKTPNVDSCDEPSSSSIPSTHSSSSQSTVEQQSSSPKTPSNATIQAAMAITGQTRASEEMPYMTPASLQQQSSDNQPQYFSGDSQDSRGYTSISVREPLAALKARQAAEGAIAALGRVSSKNGSQNQGSEAEGYYNTVSDDSADDTYACIYEGGSRGNGSETYAQIEPRPDLTPKAVPANTGGLSPPTSPSDLGGKSPGDPSPPAPPSVDSLRHVVHSRQASAGSLNSAGMGSPVAEKRGTRSPLPPLPQGDAVLYSVPDKTNSSSQAASHSPSDSQQLKSLDEMYAKVNKKGSGQNRGAGTGSVDGVNLHPGGDSSDVFGKSVQDMSHSMVETRNLDSSSIMNRAKSCEVSASWNKMSVADPAVKSGLNYETIPSLYSGSDPGYETVKNGEPAYASVNPVGNYPGYETVRGSDLESEPGYETLKQVEPGYETLSEIVTKKGPYCEPGYESLKSEPGYESVREKSSKVSSYDPGYEELAPGRTSYETDPNYEQLKFNDDKHLPRDNGYEVVDKSKTEDTYESVADYETQSKPQMTPEVTDGSMPLYASVQKKGKNKVKSEEKEAARLSGEIKSPVSIKSPLSEKESPMKEENLLDLGCGGAMDKPGTSLDKSGANFLIMDSPEEVELPPPGEDDNHRVSPYSRPGSQAEGKDFGDLLGESPAVDLIGIGNVSSMSDRKHDNLGGIEDLPPPPSLPLLSDDLVAASPPPPPPPALDELNLINDLPPPPLSHKDSEDQNGASPDNSTSSVVEVIPGTCSQPLVPADLPPPIPPTFEDSNQQGSNEPYMNGNMNVTVNPMADFEPPSEPVEPTTTSEVVPPPPPSPIVSTGESEDCAESVSSERLNGASSVESVVTVDPKSGGDPTTAPAAVVQ